MNLATGSMRSHATNDATLWKEVCLNQDFETYFARLAALPIGGQAHPWQQALGRDEVCDNRLIRIPTGFGKTFGVLGAWLWHRVMQQCGEWPRRLVWCLPMRVLVEQVVGEVQAALDRVGGTAAGVDVHALMGGVGSHDWQIHPEREAVLIGTQDMLLSRALNRGYGAPRARWPMDFGLLNQDCLWVMDEVQLMDVGLATATQLQAFRDDDSDKALRPCRTWWMSATLQPDWLACSPDTAALRAALPAPVRVPSAQRHGPLWDEVHKPVRLELAAQSKQLAALALAQHLLAGRGATGPTLVVVNRVARAVEVHDELRKLIDKDPALRGIDLRLVHSRFRPAERAGWRELFLNRAACASGTDRLIVSTQVVEAGVDMSAAVLLTELAPWPSLVQRFGRAARWGGRASVLVIDPQAKEAAPYTRAELDAATQVLRLLTDVSPASLEAFEDAHPELLPALYPFEPAHVLLRQELDDLFDTASDLSGADVDISRFIRSGDERDVQVFWRHVAPKTAPEAGIRASREELCAVPFLSVRDWLCDKDRLKVGLRAWVWDWLDGRWRALERRDIYPGQTLLVAAEVGGYDPHRGWDPKAKPGLLAAALVGPQERPEAEDLADAAESDESLSATVQWQTIAFHGWQVGRVARQLLQALIPGNPSLAGLFDLAGRWHDAGKAHPAFQGSLRPHAHGGEIAKAPTDQWQPRARLYRLPDGTARAGFRHELASTLALFALLRRCRPDHPALLGPWRELLSRIGHTDGLSAPGAGLCDAALSPLEREVLALPPEHFDLLLYLVCSHHGKVRMSWQAGPADQASRDEALRIRGVRSGDVLPALTLAAADGSRHVLAAAEMVLAPASVGLNPHTGSGWTERVLGLLQRHGPFSLAWMEAVMRAADQRASRDATLVDPALMMENDAHGLETSHSSVAGLARGGEDPPELAQHSPQRGSQHGIRGRAGGPGDAGSSTRTPAHATRYLDTRLGALSYLELAPHLGLAVEALESAIESGEFDDRLLDAQFILDLHTRLCGELTPQFIGWRQREVQVGTHEPPAPHLVPMLMYEYALDLQARLQGAGDDLLLEALAFAEGRLLSIHPFIDFNGRTSRLFLRWLLRRLDLPRVVIAPAEAASADYLEALRASDQRDWRPLMQVWRERFSGGFDS